MTNIDIPYLRSRLRYDAETGKLFWLHSDAMPPHWNGRRAGTEAFTYVGSDGYKIGTISYKGMKAHRVIWALIHGEWPEQIDHIDHNRSNNRIENLRAACPKENAKNLSMLKRNTSGVTGVRWAKRDKKWQARISVRKRDVFLGNFLKFEDAVRARKEAEDRFGYHANHGAQPN